MLAAHDNTSFIKKILFSLVILILFLVLGEGVIHLFGIHPKTSVDDPFVGFAPGSKLFIEGTDSLGRSIYHTAPIKEKFFNKQTFKTEKPKGLFRIFTMGGSTTYGHPYNDATSYSRWLREFLPLTVGYDSFEVVNAGGISYASYREYHLLQELTDYQPDLVVVYTGHNEFLEERTYRDIKQMPRPLLWLRNHLDGTHWWAALEQLIEPKQEKPKSTLDGEVNTVLDRSIGPRDYTRNPELRQNVVSHYLISLQNMAKLAKENKFRLLLLTPPSNLKDCEPFKSEYTTLDSNQINTLNNIYRLADSLYISQKYQDARQIIDSVLQLEKKHAGWWYLSGRTYLGMGDTIRAERDLKRAKQEDICPLRALDEFSAAVLQMKQEGVAVLDWEKELTAFSAKKYSSKILGDETFLDHVHLTIEAHALLASLIIQKMAQENWLSLGPKWGMQNLELIRAGIEKHLNTTDHGVALHNVAKVYNWGGKFRDAARVALRGLTLDSNTVDAVSSSLIVGADVHRRGKLDSALMHYKRAIRIDPFNRQAHEFSAVIYVEQKKWLEAEPHIKVVLDFEPQNIYWLEQMVTVQMQLQHFDFAKSILENLIRSNPNSGLYRYQYGVVNYELGQKYEAGIYINQALQLGFRGNLSDEILKQSAEKKEEIPPMLGKKKLSPAEAKAVRELMEQLKKQR